MTALRPIARAVVAAALALSPMPALAADGAPGAYLAGRQALLASDFEMASTFYRQALLSDSGNTQLMESLVLSQVAQGDIERALPVARQVEEQGLQSQVAHMAVVANLAKREDYAALLARDPETVGVGPLVDGLIASWAHLGQGDVSEALAAFDEVGQKEGLRSFALYHKSLALASVGDFEQAEAIFAETDGGLSRISRRAAIARAEILSQLDRNEDALDLLADAFSGSFDPGLTAVADQLAAGETLPFTHVRTARDGIAEVFFSIGAALRNEASDDYILVYARVASFLRPDHIDALLLSAELMDGLQQYDLAVEIYRQIPKDSPDHHAAELGRAEALRRAAKPDAAIEVLEQLSREYPNLPLVHTSLGDLYRQQENYPKAVAAYDQALADTEDGSPAEWFLHYARGISRERLKDWDEAEADFRAALELNPEQPQVLNYLGYSLVERQEKLDEALDMIERAVAARPDSGYIVDSLGWVLYRLGRYDEAVSHMEKAVELMPVDPVVNDHLGDVFWAVGRHREAEFQWKRALSFVDAEDAAGEADPKRIRRKLEVGLDKVLAEEGAPPLKVAQDQQ